MSKVEAQVVHGHVALSESTKRSLGAVRGVGFVPLSWPTVVVLVAIELAAAQRCFGGCRIRVLGTVVLALTEPGARAEARLHLP